MNSHIVNAYRRDIDAFEVAELKRIYAMQCSGRRQHRIMLAFLLILFGSGCAALGVVVATIQRAWLDFLR